MENVSAEVRKPNIIRRLYDWVLAWADSRYGTPALFVHAFAESSFFPIPADVLLIALAISKPKRSLFYAAVCTIGSVLGGMFGYYIGLEFMDVIGEKIIAFYNMGEAFDFVGQKYGQHAMWAVFTAGFTPIPYKVFTISAGAFEISFAVFVTASIAGRAGRFFLVSALIHFFGPSIKEVIDKYFNLMVIIFTILLIGGFIILKLLF